MDFSLSPKQEELKREVRQALAGFTSDYWLERYEQHRFPKEHWDALAKQGLFGISLPETYGGRGYGLLDLMLVIEEVSSAGAGAGAYPFVSNTNAAIAILKLGSEAQRQEHLPRLAKGQLKISMALTEPQSGSDALSIETFARKEDGNFVVTGRKTLINNARDADLLLLVVRTRKPRQSEKRAHGITLLLVDAKSQGLAYKPQPKAGLDILETFGIEISELKVSASNILGEEEKGWYNLVQVLNVDRITNAALCVGGGELALRTAIEYAKTRKAFGHPIGSYQGVQFPLASAHASLETARLMTYHAAWLADREQRYDAEASIALLLSSEAAVQASEAALQVHGGHGYLKERHVERYWRDLRLFRLGPLPRELMLAYVAEKVLKLPKSY